MYKASVYIAHIKIIYVNTARYLQDRKPSKTNTMYLENGQILTFLQKF